jgi:hypothetical protein
MQFSKGASTGMFNIFTLGHTTGRALAWDPLTITVSPALQQDFEAFKRFLPDVR